tara:strand:+ start:6374 stop:7264 length:891 start_codon:yes stop_codon:yes gene_type:complete
MQRFITLDKKIGETPLSCAEAWREAEDLDKDIPLAYAGRLDPMASGKLLVLIGDECKNQTNYHNLDKAYDFSVLLGVESDSLDVLGRLTPCSSPATRSDESSDSLSERVNHGLAASSALEGSESELVAHINKLTASLVGKIKLPYPRFSAKTVQGKPLHMWTLEGRLDEIEIPTKESEIYSLEFTKLETLTREQVADQARAKIDTIPEVTDPRKALGNDFRRGDVRKDWENIKNDDSLPSTYLITHFHCIASSGTYMRTLASIIAEKLGTCGLAWHIHRTNIGEYGFKNSCWQKEY